MPKSPDNKKKKNNAGFTETLKQYQDQIIKGFAVFGIAGLFGGGYLIHKTQEIKEETIANTKRNVAKNKVLLAKYHKLQHVKPLTEEQGTENLQNAVKAGTKMAYWQNQYAIAGTSTKKLRKIVKNIRPLLLTPDDEPSPWFETGNKKKPSHWIFVSKFTFTQESVSVVFQNVDSKGDIYAYTVATYNPVQYKFTNMKTTVTVLGQNAASSTGSSKKTRKRELDQQISAARKVMNETGAYKGYKQPSKKQREAMARGAEKMQKENEKKYGLDSDMPNDGTKQAKQVHRNNK